MSEKGLVGMEQRRQLGAIGMGWTGKKPLGSPVGRGTGDLRARVLQRGGGMGQGAGKERVA